MRTCVNPKLRIVQSVPLLQERRPEPLEGGGLMALLLGALMGALAMLVLIKVFNLCYQFLWG
jgi:hypothetical protein